MSKTVKTVLLVVLLVASVATVAAVAFRAMPHKALDSAEVKEADVNYRGKVVSLSKDEVNSIVGAFNSAGDWSKTYDASEWNFEVRLYLYDGSVVCLFDTGEENTIGVTRDILKRQTQYTLSDESLYSLIYNTVKEKAGPADPIEGDITDGQNQ